MRSGLNLRKLVNGRFQKISLLVYLSSIQKNRENMSEKKGLSVLIIEYTFGIGYLVF